jgi:hypothetical protein
VGGTGLEPVTPSLSIWCSRSRQCGDVRSSSIVERNPSSDRTLKRTRTNADPCHSCHATPAFAAAAQLEIRVRFGWTVIRSSGPSSEAHPGAAGHAAPVSYASGSVRISPQAFRHSLQIAAVSVEALVVFEPAGVVFRGWRGPRGVGERGCHAQRCHAELAARVAISGVFSPVVGEVAVSALPDPVRMRRTSAQRALERRSDMRRGSWADRGRRGGSPIEPASTDRLLRNGRERCTPARVARRVERGFAGSPHRVP